MRVTSYLLSIGAGLAVGVAYGLSGVRSPAPPVIALLGLLGILIGEQAVAFLRGHATAAQAVTRACDHAPHPETPRCQTRPS